MEATKAALSSPWATSMASSAFEAAQSLAPVWGLFLAGVIVGRLLPRVSRPGRVPKALPVSSLLTRWSQAVLVFHLVVILKDVWHHIAHPGTLRGLLRATVQWACGRGWSFQWPASVGNTSLLDAASEGSSEDASIECSSSSAEWYVTEKDLAFFEYHAVQNGPCDGATPWELMFDKDVPNFVRYRAWRRTLPGGKTEYKSVTIAPDVTPQEFMDMYLDDAFRRNWDGMVIHHEVLEHGDFAERQQVVRWIRRFPFAFLSDREYAIARRLFRGDDGSLTACTKAVTHPREYANSSVVRMDVYHSHWRSVAVECPWGSGRPATETTLLHHEQFKIPERLGRFAVTHGMWGFVRKLSSMVPQYVEARRRRCGSHEEDPAAYGAGFAPNPPHRHGGCGDADGGGGSISGASAGSEEWGGAAATTGRADAYRPRRGGLRKAAALALVGGALLAAGVRRGGGGGGGAAATEKQRPARRELGAALCE
ncbi:MAG: hypothetical protein J3K34DRAFT_386657 [Monoraphidium minutum]|nr:MAG: hypothetical protein J3K34DRAFT_386657 [Monoraphidium minutum]